MLSFEIDDAQLNRLIADLEATDMQVKFALSRALRRTAGTLRAMSAKGFKSELDVKRMNAIRNRLKSIRFRQASVEGMTLWYGLNDLPVSALRGRLKKTPTGASFEGKAGRHHIDGGFIVRGQYNNGQRSIFKRIGKARTPVAEATLPIKDKMDVFIEDNIFDKVDAIFWKNFQQDLTARVKQGVGSTTYRNARA